MLSPGRTRPSAPGPGTPAPGIVWLSGGSPVASLPYFESDASISNIGQWFFSREVKSFTEKSTFVVRIPHVDMRKLKKTGLQVYLTGNPVKVCLWRPALNASFCRKWHHRWEYLLPQLLPKMGVYPLCGLLSTSGPNTATLAIALGPGKQTLYSQGIFSKVIKLLFMYLFIFKLAGWLAVLVPNQKLNLSSDSERAKS